MVEKVTDPSKIVTDQLVLKRFTEQGIDSDYVEFWHDYAPRNKGREYSPYAKFYRDLKSNKRFMVVSGLPMVKPDGVKIEAGWIKQGARYVSKANLFSAIVGDKQIQVTCLSDQPNGMKKGDRVTWQPQLFLDGLEIVGSGSTLLPVDPTNPNYRENTLEWDYGICKRRLRIIEGRIHGYWIFPFNPNGEVRIKYNQIGDYKLKLGQFKVNDDEEIIPANVFAGAEYPFVVSDSSTFYPDPHTENTSVDGIVMMLSEVATWAAIVGDVGDLGTDTGSAGSLIWIESTTTTDRWQQLNRGIFLFNTSGLDDDAVISAAVMSLYGVSKFDDGSFTPDINIYSSAPASNTAVVAGDYDSLGTTALSTAITYAGFNTSGYNDFALIDVDTDNFGYIKKTAGDPITKLGARNASYDVAEEVSGGSSPTWVSGKYTQLEIYFAEQGSGFKPKLVVTYTVLVAAPGGSPLAQMIQAGLV